MGQFRVCAGFGLVLSLGMARSTSAVTTTTVNPAEDAYISANQPNNSFGSGGALEISGAAQGNGEYQTLMKFDLSGPKALFDTTYGVGNWAVQSATLRVTSIGPVHPSFNPNTAGQVAVRWMNNDSWVEGSGTPANPGTDGVTFATLPSFLSVSDQALGAFTYNGGAGNFTHTLTTNASLFSDIAGGGSVSLRLLAGDTTVSLLMNSSNNFSNPAAQPLLSVTANAVPEPGVMMLGMIGFVVVLSARQRP